jgi:hypothetical protein
MKEKLTVEKLKEMKPDEIFATGDLLYRRWVAVRGEMWDWAVYYGDIYDSPSAIALNGDKIYDRELIEFLVPSEPEALLLYRN